VGVVHSRYGRLQVRHADGRASRLRVSQSPGTARGVCLCRDMRRHLALARQYGFWETRTRDRLVHVDTARGQGSAHARAQRDRIGVRAFASNTLLGLGARLGAGASERPRVPQKPYWRARPRGRRMSQHRQTPRAVPGDWGTRGRSRADDATTRRRRRDDATMRPNPAETSASRVNHQHAAR